MSDELFEREQDDFDALERAYATAYPNLDRIGCLDSQTLQDMANGRIVPSSPDDPRLYHVTHCSPCFRELIEFRDERREARHERELTNQHRRKATYAAGTAAIALICLLTWFWLRQPAPVQPPIARIDPAPNLPYSPATLDLRPFTVSRGESAQGAKSTLALRRGQLALSIYLPVGMDEGPAEVRIMDNQLQNVLLSQPTQAVLQNNTVTIKARVNLSSLAPGQYTLAVRPADQSWRTYRLEIE